MNVIGERSIASLIRRLLDASWWLVAVSAVLLLALLLLSAFVNLDSKHLTMDIPVAVHLDSPIHSGGSPGPSEATIEKLRGDLRFPVRNGGFLAGSTALILVLSGCLLWALTQLREIFRSLSQGLPFIPENALRIRWVGLTVIAGEVIRAALVYFWSYYTSLHFTANGLHFVASTDLSGITILSGLALLVIAEVFREGTRLREEQSLTI